MLIEVHMLKNYPATNLNRDDTGAPKTCMFGGVQRGRISSQCLKRSWRKSGLFAEMIGEDKIGVRTRKLPEILAKALKDRGYDDEYVMAAEKLASAIGNKDGKASKDISRTQQIIIYSKEDIDAIVDIFDQKLKTCKKAADVSKLSIKDIQGDLKKSSSRSVSLDIALFGRMVTSDAFADVEASMQVAHAISTNRVMMESDYFTAVDDLINGIDENGSGMIGDVDYNSSCFYMYVAIDVEKLIENLGCGEEARSLAKVAIPALIQTMAFTNPSGKQNTFAGHSLPSAILVECKEKKIPVSLVNAFEVPVWANQDGGYIKHSIEKLIEEDMKIQNSFSIPVKERLWFNTEGISNENMNAEMFNSFTDMIEKIRNIIGDDSNE